MARLDPLKALMLLSECTGDDIWSPEHCRQRGVPAVWLEELSDAFESSFEDDRDTIYVGPTAVNQYHGFRDVDLAVKLGEFLGIDTQAVAAQAFSRAELVRLIREAVEED
ncbi:MAG: hypothetical protein KDA45_03695 [Planctomycetales bacterium]|nr:hypothetical protein [Planctomycetales bacterium]